MIQTKSDLTPAGLQSRRVLAQRRFFVALACFGLYALLLSWLAAILNSGGWSVLRVGILVAFAAAAPWSILGVCNAAIGFWLLHFHADPLSQAAPFARIDETGAPRTRTAVLMTLRNEDAKRAFARLRSVKASLDATGHGHAFDFFVLSDTTAPRVAEAEEVEIAAWRLEIRDAQRLHYRRRGDNTGFKAGNIGDFCERWGAGYEFMIPLDADSLMDGQTILRLVRIGEEHPRLGILQSLAVGAPSRSAFARIFQFGMRQGMRAYTLGATWWAGDCGPFWGHNALVRIAPFIEHCALPSLRDGAPILSHDQLEAALMRRGGFEVRILPVECGSFEENPPTLLDFVQRESRWCQGNMQYFQLLATPSLAPTSRFHLAWAISMFIGPPAWTAIIVLATLIPLVEDMRTFPSASAATFYLLFMAFNLTPKLAGYLDIAVTPGGMTGYGGAGRFCAGALVETFGSFVIGAATMLNISLLLLFLPFGRTIDWGAQARDAHGVSWRTASRAFWPHLTFGGIVLGIGALFAPRLALWSLPLTFGYVAAIPFAVATASPKLGQSFMKWGLCATPEERRSLGILRPHYAVRAESAIGRTSIDVAAIGGKIAIKQDLPVAQ
jgi:membrane glycosyltransferase